MKTNISRYFIFPFTILIFSCSNRSNEIELKQRKIDAFVAQQKRQDSITKEVMRRRYEAENITKYVIVTILADKPTLIKEPFDIPQPEEYKSSKVTTGTSLSAGITPQPVDPHFLESPSSIKYFTKIISNPTFFVSDVFEITQYNQDKRYMKMDEFEAQIQNQLDYRDRLYISEKSVLFEDATRAKSKIQVRTSHEFDTYQAASEFRQKYREN